MSKNRKDRWAGYSVTQEEVSFDARLLSRRGIHITQRLDDWREFGRERQSRTIGRIRRAKEEGSC